MYNNHYNYAYAYHTSILDSVRVKVFITDHPNFVKVYWRNYKPNLLYSLLEELYFIVQFITDLIGFKIKQIHNPQLIFSTFYKHLFYYIHYIHYIHATEK